MGESVAFPYLARLILRTASGCDVVAVMLDKLIAETEKEMQAVKDAEQRKDLQELDTLTHHLRSSWQILRADQPLRELYAQLHGSATPDDEAICKAVTGCAG